MTRLSLLLIPLLFVLSPALAQKQADYERQWKTVDSLATLQGKARSAEALAWKIQSRARSEGNETQVIKALIYLLQLTEETRENTDSAGISMLEKETASASGPARSILQSLTAEAYWNYFQGHRWALYGRTHITGPVTGGIGTWTIDDFHNRISALYLASLGEEKRLQNTRLDPYDPILVKGNMRSLRPTLFDLLANRALAYLTDQEYDITQPAYAFTLDDTAAFAPAGIFITHPFAASDTASLQWKALRLYQQLLAFHRKDERPDALIDADLGRLAFANRYSTSDHKGVLYRTAIRQLAEAYPHQAAASQAAYLLAEQWQLSGMNYDPLDADSSGRYDINRTIDLCTALIREFPSSEGGIHAAGLLKRLLTPSMQLQTETVNVPGIPFRALVRFKNMDSLCFRLFPYPKKGESDRQAITLLAARRPLREWIQPLPATGDHQFHQAEIRVDPLPPGEYMLIGSKDPDFRAEKNPMTAQHIYVSSISCIGSASRGGWNDYFVLDRETGQPLAGASIQVWSSAYDYPARRDTLIKQERYISDRNGHFHVSGMPGTYRNIRLDIHFGNDSLFTDNTRNVSIASSDMDTAVETDPLAFERSHATFYLFTDRGIYRPGQTIFFKGIGITEDAHLPGHNNKLFTSSDSILVYLKDANGQDIDSLRCLPDDFGSVKGFFHLPLHALTGNFTLALSSIADEGGSFRVEEYKRPAFYVELSGQKGMYRLGDTITVNGSGKAYAGNNITGARVAYSVTRQSRSLSDRWLSGPIRRPSNARQIARGTATTGSDGSFSLQFKAVPDLSQQPGSDPVFDYRVSVDVTDINGETQSMEKVISIGYKSLVIDAGVSYDIPLDADSLYTIPVSAANVEGKEQVVPMTVSISRLISPGRAIRSRYWERPDVFVMDKADFLQSFPHDEYQAESDFHNWPAEAPMVRDTFTTGKNKGVNVSGFHFNSGIYRMEMNTRDTFGKPVQEVAFFQVYDPHTMKIPYPAYQWTAGGAGPVEPGGSAVFSLGSSSGTGLFIIRQRSYPGQNKTVTSYGEFTSSPDRLQSFVIPVSEEDRGGFTISQAYVADNRFYQNDFRVSVPWDNRELDIRYKTFSDKTEPGSPQVWTVTIRNKKGGPVPAEVLAGMYDASLDQFNANPWNIPAIYPDISTEDFIDWDDADNFTSRRAQNFYDDKDTVRIYTKTYDQLIGLAGRPMNMMLNQKIFIRGRADGVEVDASPAARMMAPEPASPAEDQKAIAFSPASEPPITIRRNFNETAFFFPDLHTDSAGDVSFSFTMPEALTRWKLQTLAHTRNLSFGLDERTIVTRKTLMLQPNMPRFLREGDLVTLSTKIASLDTGTLSGKVRLELLDAVTMQPIDASFGNTSPEKPYTIKPGQSVAIGFPVTIPDHFDHPVTWRLTADGGNFSDGQEASLPVLPGRTLLTESLPLLLQGDSAREFHFDRLLKSAEATAAGAGTIPVRLTLEYCSNPAWTVIQAIPYLMEFPFECSEQTFNRYYANMLGAFILRKTPRIRAVLQAWESDTGKTGELSSNLQKDQELKSALLEETPWVLQADNETVQKHYLAKLMDTTGLAGRQQAILDKLIQLQTPGGGFAWFSGGPDDRYITQYIVSGIGHLTHLHALSLPATQPLQPLLAAALIYLDRRIAEDYRRERKAKEPVIDPITIQYLYARSFFPLMPLSDSARKAWNFYTGLARKQWVSQPKYLQGMIALALYRSADRPEDRVTTGNILASLEETSINLPETGRYWKNNSEGGYGDESPAEAQALLIEAFTETKDRARLVNSLRTWLLIQKQTQAWPTTKATADACYALLLQGNDWLADSLSVQVRLGDTLVDSRQEKTSAGTGYFKKQWDGSRIQPGMGDIRISVQRPSTHAPGVGAVYYQYFQNIDAVTTSQTGISIQKQLYRVYTSDRGEEMTQVKRGDPVHVGDRIRVRLVVRSDRDLAYVHLKDLRAACMEPVNVLSGYRWQGGLGYYQSTLDASTNFFFSTLPRGTHVLEYDLNVAQTGTFSEGLATLQCLYAPQFTAHSEGLTIKSQP